MPKIIKSKNTKKTEERRWEFSAFRLFKAENEKDLTAVNSINCDCKDGVLTTGIGVTAYQTSENLALDPKYAAKKIYLLPTKDSQGKELPDEVFFTSRYDSTYRYSAELKTFVRILEDVPTYTLFTMWDVMKGTSLFVGTESVLGVSKNNGESFTGVTSTDGQARAFKNRVFAADGNNVHYSAPNDTSDFSESLESGTLYGDVTDGKICGLADWQDALYVFAENGVRKITASGSPTQFTMEKVCDFHKRIFKGTARLCKDGIFLLAEDGVYRFDGKRMGQVCEHLSIKPVCGVERYESAAYADRYYLCYKDEKKGRCLAVLNADGRSGYFAQPVEGLTQNANGVVCRMDTRICFLDEYGGGIGESVFETSEITFGKAGKKTLKRLRFFGAGAFSLTVKGKGWERTKRVLLEQGEGAWTLFSRSDAFTFRFVLERGARIEKMYADVVFA